MPETKLLPCPFCGGKTVKIVYWDEEEQNEKVWEHGVKQDENHYYVIRCYDCDIQFFGGTPISGYELIEAWNKRANTKRRSMGMSRKHRRLIMREILFRGKDIKGNWYEGLLMHEKRKDEWYVSNKAGVPTAYQVRPETIGQYIGMVDCNGTKIFEGDIIQDGNCEYNKYVVEYSPERGGYLPFAHGDGCGCCETATLYDSTCHTVIGNIYDNPELMKE